MGQLCSIVNLSYYIAQRVSDLSGATGQGWDLAMCDLRWALPVASLMLALGSGGMSTGVDVNAG